MPTLSKEDRLDKLKDIKIESLSDEILFKCIIKGEKPAQVAKDSDCHRSYVYSVIKPYKDILLSNDEVKQVKENYNRLLWSTNAQLLFDMMDKSKREKASLNNTAYAQASLNNQIRLDEDKSTQNTQIFDIVEERRRIEEEQEKLKNSP